MIIKHQPRGGGGPYPNEGLQQGAKVDNPVNFNKLPFMKDLKKKKTGD